MSNINREDNSSYEIARRVAALEDQTDRLIRLTEDLINIQQKIFNRLENLEKQPKVNAAKRHQLVPKSPYDCGGSK